MTVEMLWKFLCKQMKNGNAEMEVSVMLDGKHQTLPIQEVNLDDREIVLDVDSFT